MPYDPIVVQPMREELTRLGVRELRTADEVDQVLGRSQGTTMVVVNSVCGCAAANARPAVALALRHEDRPERVVTVFAGQDVEATARAREYFTGFRPSSPSIALLRDGELVFMLERHQIEGREAEVIARDMTDAFDRFCALGQVPDLPRVSVSEAELAQIARFENEGGASSWQKAAHGEREDISSDR
jgi:putative YphP/YqiW family bacilliredoxin